MHVSFLFYKSLNYWEVSDKFSQLLTFETTKWNTDNRRWRLKHKRLTRNINYLNPLGLYKYLHVYKLYKSRWDCCLIWISIVCDPVNDLNSKYIKMFLSNLETKGWKVQVDEYRSSELIEENNWKGKKYSPHWVRGRRKFFPLKSSSSTTNFKAYRSNFLIYPGPPYQKKNDAATTAVTEQHKSHGKVNLRSLS